MKVSRNSSSILGHLPRSLAPKQESASPRIYGRDSFQRAQKLDWQEQVKPSSFQLELPLEYPTPKQGRELLSVDQEQESESVADKILPKDHSLLVDAMEIQWQESGVGAILFDELVQIGSQEGFSVTAYTSGARKGGIGEEVTARTFGEQLQAQGYENFQIVAGSSVNTWLEDASETTGSNERVLAGDLPYGKLSGKSLKDAILEARRLRTGFDDTDFPTLGNVAKNKAVETAELQALINGEKVSRARSYIEGGNMLSGTRGDGSPYLLLGKDSLEVTRLKLSLEERREVSHTEALSVVAEDYGFEAADVVAVEQPGAFHIDMRLSPIGPGEFILQDSAAAAHSQVSELVSSGADTAEIEAVRAWGKKMSKFEKLAERDLVEAGFQVHRIVGALPAGDFENDEVNFFNARHGTNDEGERYSIFLGADPVQEDAFATTLLEGLNAPIDRLYFTDPKATEKTLKLRGGLKCRTKMRGSRA